MCANCPRQATVELLSFAVRQRIHCRAQPTILVSLPPNMDVSVIFLDRQRARHARRWRIVKRSSQNDPNHVQPIVNYTPRVLRTGSCHNEKGCVIFAAMEQLAFVCWPCTPGPSNCHRSHEIGHHHELLAHPFQGRSKVHFRDGR